MEMVKRRIDKATKAGQSGDKKFLHEAEVFNGARSRIWMTASPPAPLTCDDEERAIVRDERTC